MSDEDNSATFVSNLNDGATEPVARDAHGELVRVWDVIQVDPEHGPWGPLLLTVDEVRAWGVIAYAMIPGVRGTAPGHAPFRLESKQFVRIGRSEWHPAEAPQP